MQNAFASDDAAEKDSIEAFVGDTLHLFDEEMELPATVDELFNDFFFNYVDDARFQSQRTVFPLPIVEGEEEMPLDKQEWTAFDHFKDQEAFSYIYEREQDLDLQNDTTLQNVVIEWVPLDERLVEKFNFQRMEGKWMLASIHKVLRDNIPNGEFLDFYAQFVTDSTFQRESLALPIKMILTSEDGEEEPQEELLDADDWFAMKDDLPLPRHELVNIDYGQTCISQNRKTLMMEGNSNGLQIKFKFDKQDDHWKLIEIEY